MAFKFVTLFAALVAVASAGVVPATPLAAVAKFEEYDPHPQYSYGYDVKDAISGDSKTAVETRDGGFVQGQYSLNDADGYRRIVDYTSDPINGFNAVVRREPLVAAAPVVKAAVAAPVVAAPAPVVKAAVAAPFTYAAAAPVVKAAYATAPFTYAAAPVVKTVAPAHFGYAAPAAYAAAPVVKAVAPATFGYAAPAAYAAAPVVKAAVAGPAVVKTSFASPLISYAY
ncbi:larval cuticle protein A3A-like [Musca vetustissima]|uniref:larval cuticle protein A3A-like n=1 Tax=Musca vetustissima TaxID=27455 RepID=UPI002AB7E45C|nr:larval cuticle protein A3A-like [Musca vetustissima]